MPFGSDPFRDGERGGRDLFDVERGSPMPFGSDPFRDRADPLLRHAVAPPVTNAFRQ